MKSVLTGIVLSVLLAIGAWAVLDGTLQRDAENAYTTPSARP
ncbi:hypothetical protein [Roseomonas sp. BN140053]